MASSTRIENLVSGDLMISITADTHTEAIDAFVLAVNNYDTRRIMIYTLTYGTIAPAYMIAAFLGH